MIKNIILKIDTLISKLTEGLSNKTRKVLRVFLWGIVIIVALFATYITIRYSFWFILGGIIAGIIILVKRKKARRNK